MQLEEKLKQSIELLVTEGFTFGLTYHNKQTIMCYPCSTLCLSNVFFVTNGVRQGGILSPMFFNIYIDGLSDILNNSIIGGSIGGIRVNHMLYADDLCIISLSSADLQQLLVQCDDYCRKHSINFNVSKSICMFFKSAVSRKCNTTDLFLSSKAIDFVQETKYLGVMLNSQ